MGSRVLGGLVGVVLLGSCWSRDGFRRPPETNEPALIGADGRAGDHPRGDGTGLGDGVGDAVAGDTLDGDGPPTPGDVRAGDVASGDATMGDGAMGDTAMGDTAMGDTAMGDTAMGDTAMGDGAMGDTAMGDSRGPDNFVGDFLSGDSAIMCRAVAAPASPLGPSAVVSDLAASNDMRDPDVAVRGSEAFAIWWFFSSGFGIVQYTIIDAGCVTGVQALIDAPMSDFRNPSVAATATGYEVVYSANDSVNRVIRRATFDPSGMITDGPTTISNPLMSSEHPDVAVSGGDISYVWFDGTRHRASVRGPTETVSDIDASGALTDISFANVPVLTRSATRTIVVWRDGATAAGREVFWVERDHLATFTVPDNLSLTPGAQSDYPAVGVRADGTTEIAWVEGTAGTDIFKAAITPMAVGPGVALMSPAGLDWGPCVGEEGRVAWALNALNAGEIQLNEGVTTTRVDAPTTGGQCALAANTAADLYLVYVDWPPPRQVRFAWR